MTTDKIRFRLYIGVFAFLLLLGTLGFKFIENLSLGNAAYFSIVTMATVGYGDIHPQTAAGKILAIILIVGGVGTFLGVVASFTDLFVKRREELIQNQKMNMINGLFFSELGNGLLIRFVKLDPEKNALFMILRITNQWGDNDFFNAKTGLKKHVFVIKSENGDLSELRDFLQKHEGLLLRLLENPIFHEHEAFSDMLQAIFHLRDELIHRTDILNLIESDRKHIEGDILRIYKLLVGEWIRHMDYLKNNYQYLFSLAVRLNPFDPEASAVIKDS